MGQRIQRRASRTPQQAKEEETLLDSRTRRGSEVLQGRHVIRVPSTPWLLARALWVSCQAISRQVQTTLQSLPAVAVQPMKIPASHTKVKKPGQGCPHSCHRVRGQAARARAAPRCPGTAAFSSQAASSAVPHAQREYPYPRGKLPSSHREHRP